MYSFMKFEVFSSFTINVRDFFILFSGGYSFLFEFECVKRFLGEIVVGVGGVLVITKVFRLKTNIAEHMIRC